jgi:hypothetical protein
MAKKEATEMDRRHFLSRVGTIAAATGAAISATSSLGETPTATPSPKPLPTIALGKYQVTRLVAGSNPINGSSYLGPNLDKQMSEYFTIDRAVEFLLSCEAAGINTHQFSASASDKAANYIPRLRDQGSRLQFFCIDSRRPELKKVIEQTRPLGIAHHGSSTDGAFSSGKPQQVHDYVKAVHDQGLLAGVSSHNPDNIRKIAEEGWEVDFFMTCFYFMSRRAAKGEKSAEQQTVDTRGPFYGGDPAVMTAVVRSVKQPCFGFKILAAGRMGSPRGDQSRVREAFRFAFQNIKPIDGVIVGMFPQYFDEVKLNVGHAREFA